MTIIDAVIVDGALQYWPQYFGSLTGVWDPTLTHFRIGEGGWKDPGTGVPVRKTPAATLTDLDCIVNAGSFPSTSQYYFEKALIGANFTYSNNTLVIECTLTNAEGNDAGSASFWEIGIYSDHPSGVGKLLVAYGTFEKITKTAADPQTVTVRISFGR